MSHIKTTGTVRVERVTRPEETKTRKWVVKAEEEEEE
jgi:hypothetical protein